MYVDPSNGGETTCINCGYIDYDLNTLVVVEAAASGAQLKA
jgi:hypothetical protein